jgi:hypothetical protein
MGKQGNGSKSATAERPPTKPKQPPEKKIGPFANGIGVCIWLNRIETDQGERTVRSITVNPRRYFDRESNQWKDAGGYNPADLPALIFCLQKAQEFVYETPLPRQGAGETGGEQQPPDEDIPF